MNVRTPLRITAALTLLPACGSGDGRVEEAPATTVAVTTAAADTSKVTPEPDFQRSISGFLLDEQDEEIVLRSVPDLAVVASFPKGMFSTENDTAYVTIGPDGVVVSIYR